jgi:SNF2 family DNA or RNA helicase
MHERIAAGERHPFPWRDTDGDTRPWAHQEIMATAAVWVNGIYFQAQPGTGKTRAGLEAACALLEARALDVILVVAPRRVATTWAQQIPRYAPTLVPIRLSSGKLTEREAAIRGAVRGSVITINYDVLTKLEGAILALCARCKVGVIYDEAHKLKNPRAQRTVSAMNISQQAKWRLAMSGTPVLQGALDVWSQWYCIDLGSTFGRNFVQYRREYFDESAFTHEITARNGALETVGTMMRRRGLRFLKSECLDLPPKVYETLTCTMTAEQSSAYEQLRDYLYAQLAESGDTLTVANQLALTLRLSQVTSGYLPTDDGNRVRFTPNPKLDLCDEFVEEIVATDSSVIIWARYREDVVRLQEKLARFGPVVVQGGQTDLETDHAVRDFQSGRTKVLIGNAAAGGAGLDLWRASYAIYYSQDYSLEHRIQSEDRCHRGGSEIHNHVTYLDLMCEGTVDEIVATSLRNKETLAGVVTDLRAHLAPARHGA